MSSGGCGGGRPSSDSGGSGAHYALCALGVGLVALGIVMIVWTVIPANQNGTAPTKQPGNSTAVPSPGFDDPEDRKSSTVALVLVGVGLVMLFLSICLAVRSKRRARAAEANRTVETGGPLMGHVTGEVEQEAVDPITYNVPSYDEVVGSDTYPVRQSNLQRSSSQLPSYEDIIAAVENEGRTEDSAADPSTTPAASEEHPPLQQNPSLPTRSSSRASRLLRPLKVRRIKSDKLHLKDFRLQIRTPTHNPVTIEPITPPPQYENKMPELQ